MKKILLLLTFLTSIYSVSFAQCTNSITPGIIGSVQTICYNTLPSTITQIAAPTNIIGTPTYTWEASTSGIAWYALPAIPNYTNTYSFTSPLIHNIYIRRIVTDPGTPAPCNFAISNTIYIIVLPQLTAGIIGSDEAICAGAVPSTITQLVAPTGGTGTYTYQWQLQADAIGPFVHILGATNASYTPPALTATTRFHRIETSGCGTTTSQFVTKSITIPEVVTASINEPGQTCAGSPSIPFIATATTTGTGTLSYQWYLGTIPVGINSPNYSYTPVVGDDNKNVKAVVTTSNGCNTGPATSNIVTLDIRLATTPTVSIAANGNPTCENLPISFSATSTGGGPAPTYQWNVIPQGSSGSGVAVGSGGTTFSSSTLHNGDRVYVELTSSLACLIGTNPYKSDEISMTIKPIPNPLIIGGDQVICSPSSFTYHANVGAGTTLQWILNGNSIPGATNTSYTAIQSGTYYIREDNGVCSYASTPVILTITPTPQANAGQDQYVLANTLATLNASGGTLYSWSPAAELSNPNIQNPTITISATTEFTVTASDASRLCSTADNVIIYVTDAPVGSFSTSITGPNPVMPGQQNARYGVPNQTGFTYTWSVTGGTIVSGQNTNSVLVDWDAPATNAFTRITSSSYSISVLEKKPSNQTKTTTATINTITTGVALSQAQSGINVFPNPTTGSFNIEMPESGVDVSYEILDLSGLSVGSGTFTSTGNNQNIHADFGAGMYQVVLKYNNAVTCVRLSKIQ